MNKIYDAKIELEKAIAKTKINLGELIAETALFAHSKVQEDLFKDNDYGVWRYKCKRIQHGKKYLDKDTGIYWDDNTIANGALKRALGIDSKDLLDYEVCHIYLKSCYDERYHTCIANLVLLPRAIASLSDYSDNIMEILQYRSYELYNWYPKDINGNKINEPIKPSNYPKNWKEPFEYTDTVKKSIQRRKNKGI